MIVLGVALAASVRVIREYERAVVFRLGRLLPVRGPGLVALVPLVDRMVRVDLRTVTLTIPPQEVITRDNVPARVAAVCYFRVVDPAAAITQVEAFAPATSQIAQTTLRSVLGGADLDELLAERERLNEQLQRIIDEHTEPWGIKVTTVEIKDVEIPEAMQRAMARQAEAERERRAKIIGAEGEFQAAEKLAGAAAMLGRSRPRSSCATCRRCVEVGAEQSSTIVFPLPLDLLGPLLRRRRTRSPRPAQRRRTAAGARRRAPRRVDARPLSPSRRAGLLRRRPADARRRGRAGGAPARERAAMRSVARRFGIGSLSRSPCCSRPARRWLDRRRWGDSLLQVKLMVIVLVGVLVGLHIASPQSRAVAIAVFFASLALVWLGVELSHG